MNAKAYFPAGSDVSFPESRDVKSLVNYGLALYKLRRQVTDERKQLAGLSDELLADIGVARGDAMLESRRDPGDLPQDRIDEIKT